MADESNGRHVVDVRPISSDIKGQGWFSVRARLDLLLPLDSDASLHALSAGAHLLSRHPLGSGPRSNVSPIRCSHAEFRVSRFTPRVSEIQTRRAIYSTRCNSK